MTRCNYFYVIDTFFKNGVVRDCFSEQLFSYERYHFKVTLLTRNGVNIILSML